MTLRDKSIFYAVVAVVVLVWIVKLSTPSAPPAPLPQRVAVNYDLRKICPEAWNTAIDHRTDSPSYFDVDLTPGCWSGFVYIPKAWRDYVLDPVGDASGWWVALWYSGEAQGRGPFGPKQVPRFGNVPPQIRLQGKGTVRIYTTAAPSVPVTVPRPKPDDQGIYTPGGMVSDPKVIHKVEAQYTTEARKAHFKGTISVALVIGEDGRARDIKIEDSPGYGLDEQITEALGRWKFKPAELDGKPVPVHGHIEFTFRRL